MEFKAAIELMALSVVPGIVTGDPRVPLWHPHAHPSTPDAHSHAPGSPLCPPGPRGGWSLLRASLGTSGEPPLPMAPETRQLVAGAELVSFSVGRPGQMSCTLTAASLSCPCCSLTSPDIPGSPCEHPREMGRWLLNVDEGSSPGGALLTPGLGLCLLPFWESDLLKRRRGWTVGKKLPL